MRYLILSDLHSNLEALENALETAQGKYDEVLCLGDLVGYGPNPNEVTNRLRALAKIIIRGNHDKACAGTSDAEHFNPVAYMAVQWTRHQLTPENFAFLGTLPAGPININEFQICHGAPLDEDEYILTPAHAAPALRELKKPLVFFGHTHFQGGFILSSDGRFHSVRCPAGEGLVFTLALENGSRYLLNPGSIGQPRDGDWRAGFAIYDEKQQRIEFYRTGYDVAVTQDKMRQAGLPEPLIKRLGLGR